jgi:hypothetical protein
MRSSLSVGRRNRRAGVMVPLGVQEVKVGTLNKFDFQAIPQDFLDLVFRYHLRTNIANTFENCETSLNGHKVDASYRWSQAQFLNGATGYTNNLGAAQVRNIAQPTGATAPAGAFTTGQFTIAGYARTDNRKVVHVDRHMSQLSDLATGMLNKVGFLAKINNLDAINRVEMEPASGGLFVVGSYVHMYGVMPGFE